MKRHTQRLLSEWGCSAWDMLLRTIWLGLAVAALIAVLRLCAWSDTGIRYESPIEKSIIPTK